MSTDLVHINDGGALVTIPEITTGLEEYARLRPTSIQLVQPVTRDPGDARPGQFLDVLTREVFDTINVVPLKVQKKRVMFPPGGDLDSEPICRSDNGSTPSQYVETPQSMTCSTCKESQWYGGKRSACAEKFALYFIVKELELPRFINIGGVSIGAWKLTMDRLAQDIIRAKAKEGIRLDLFDYCFTISSENIKGKKGNFYVLKFTDIVRVSNPGKYGPFFKQFIVEAARRGEEIEAADAAAKADNSVTDAVDAEFVDV